MVDREDEREGEIVVVSTRIFPLSRSGMEVRPSIRL